MRLRSQIASALSPTVTFFDDGRAPAPEPAAKRNRGQKSSGSKKAPTNPCQGCPRESAIKVKPFIPAHPKAIAVGLAPGAREEEQGIPFVGPSGDLLREALRAAGIDPDVDMAYLNLGRCRPEHDDFETKEWATAEKRCNAYLVQDLERMPELLPMLLLGARPAARFLGKKSVAVSTYRGLFVQLPGSARSTFVARHPSSILRAHGEERQRLEHQFFEDVRRFGNRLLGREMALPCSVKIFPTLEHAKPFLAKLAEYLGPWAFDIESYDAMQCPGRMEVSTDPCHPDFRLRGIAIALSSKVGYWLELAGSTPEQAQPFLSPAFASAAPKRTFNGSFDEESLIYPGWVREVRARTEDAMLAFVALSDGRRGTGDLRLERLLVDLIGWPQYWNLNKALMRELPLKDVARGSVLDACGTFKLCDWVRDRLERGEHIGGMPVTT